MSVLLQLIFDIAVWGIMLTAAMAVAVDCGCSASCMILVVALCGVLVVAVCVGVVSVALLFSLIYVVVFLV